MTSTPRPPKTVRDLMAVTGFSEQLVRAAIRSGELPGYVAGTRFTIPADAFDAFCRGEWKPQPRPVLAQPAQPLLRRRSVGGPS